MKAWSINMSSEEKQREPMKNDLEAVKITAESVPFSFLTRHGYQASSTFLLGQPTWHDGVIPPNKIWIKLGGDKGGLSVKMSFEIVNTDKPNSCCESAYCPGAVQRCHFQATKDTMEDELSISYLSLKLYLLEDHLVPWMKRWRIGCGCMGEQGAESLHASFHDTERAYKNMRDRVDRLHVVLQNHHFRILPFTQSLEPPLLKKRRAKEDKEML
uniref:Uncharacterized protein n=1 Tax=Amphimedon queenslandica TaxID=400682 RepID=A0A1X7UTF6_AMPQE